MLTKGLKSKILTALAFALALSFCVGVIGFSSKSEKEVRAAQATTDTYTNGTATITTTISADGLSYNYAFTNTSSTVTLPSTLTTGNNTLTIVNKAKIKNESGGCLSLYSNTNLSLLQYFCVKLPLESSGTIKYNGNTQTSRYLCIDKAVSTEKSKLSFALKDNTAVTFDSSVQDENGNVYFYPYGGETKMTQLTITLNRADSYSLTYETNGGDGVQGQLVKKGESTTVAQAPKREGFDFIEWNTSLDGSGTAYQPNDAITPQSNVTLYAIWEGKSFNVSFDTGEEIISGLPTKAQAGQTVQLPEITKENYEVIWTITDSNGNVVTTDGKTFIMPGADVTAVVKFKEVGLFTVTFMDGSKPYVTVDVRNGSTVERPQDPPTKDGALRFGGWYTDQSKSSNGNKFDFDGDVITADITLYSLWIDPVDTQSFQSYVDGLIDKTAANIKGKPVWATEGFKNKFNYIDGVFLNGVVNLYYSTDNNKYKNFFLDFITNYVNSDGDLTNTSGTKTSLPKELDHVCECKVLFDAYELSGDVKYIKAIEKNFKHLLSMGRVTETNAQADFRNYEHKSSYSQQVWLDGMYMYAPFNARYLSSTEADVSEFHKLRMQYQFIFDNMRDEKTGLYYHAWSKASGIQWASAQNNYCSPNFWLRSVGWLTMSLADVIEYFPGGEDRDFLISMYQSLVDSLLEFKDDDTGMYYQIVDHTSFIEGETKRNYLEVSGSSMIAYALLKGGRLGYLKSDTINYRQEGEKAFEGIFSHSLDTSNNTLYDICKQAGLDKTGSRNGTISYYLSEPVSSNEGKGVGPFVLAFIEYTNSSPKAPITPDIRQKTINFNVDGTNTSSVTTYAGQIIAQPSQPSASGKTFSHWSTSPCNATAHDFNSAVKDDMTLYAVWQEESVNYDYKSGETFKAASQVPAAQKLSDHTLIGWLNTQDNTLHKVGDKVTQSGTYKAIIAKTSFIGGSLRKTGITGVRLGFAIEALGVTDNSELDAIANDMLASFNIRTNYDNVFNVKSYMIENEKIVMYAVITNDIDAQRSDGDKEKCSTALTASISVTFASTQETLFAEYGNFTIKDIATIALQTNQIDTALAKKYGYVSQY